ncbi:lipase 1-like [Maniola hyperantus]|uniref:lipase 1-like n=1 Tax=Aphantopus hyperantus TaxID=2795564 RepID=UPI0015699D98|nr:lipase 1-like [Maniola hyperantus]
MKFIDLSACVVIFSQLVSTSSPEIDAEDAKLYFEELAIKYGHPARKYEVITEDGYILALYNLPGSKEIPVLLMHGVFGTSDIWMLRGNISLPIALANSGYDVWVGNSRGNRYSRRHLYLDPDHDPAFWSFSFHEMGVYDLSAIIDTVIQKTGVKRINTIGHSLGTTLFFVLGSIRPEYNARINVFTALAPICYLNHIQPLSSTIAKFVPVLGKILNKLNMYEVFDEPTRSIVGQFCTLPNVGYKICVEEVLFTFIGSDPEEISPEFAKIVLPHFPSSSSLKNVIHLAQLHNRKVFAQYDYGFLRNRNVYNSSVPPEYNLKKVTMPVALTVGRNDKLSVVEDVQTLRRKLPNVVSYEESPRQEFNHLDDIWGAHMDIYLYPYIFKILEQYSEF